MSPFLLSLGPDVHQTSGRDVGHQAPLSTSSRPQTRPRLSNVCQVWLGQQHLFCFFFLRFSQTRYVPYETWQVWKLENFPGGLFPLVYTRGADREGWGLAQGHTTRQWQARAGGVGRALCPPSVPTGAWSCGAVSHLFPHIANGAWPGLQGLRD